MATNNYLPQGNPFDGMGDKFAMLQQQLGIKPYVDSYGGGNNQGGGVTIPQSNLRSSGFDPATGAPTGGPDADADGDGTPNSDDDDPAETNDDETADDLMTPTPVDISLDTVTPNTNVTQAEVDAAVAGGDTDGQTTTEKVVAALRKWAEAIGLTATVASGGTIPGGLIEKALKVVAYVVEKAPGAIDAITDWVSSVGLSDTITITNNDDGTPVVQTTKPNGETVTVSATDSQTGEIHIDGGTITNGDGTITLSDGTIVNADGTPITNGGDTVVTGTTTPPGRRDVEADDLIEDAFGMADPNGPYSIENLFNQSEGRVTAATDTFNTGVDNILADMDEFDDFYFGASTALQDEASAVRDQFADFAGANLNDQQDLTTGYQDFSMGQNDKYDEAQDWYSGQVGGLSDLNLSTPYGDIGLAPTAHAGMINDIYTTGVGGITDQSSTGSQAFGDISGSLGDILGGGTSAFGGITDSQNVEGNILANLGSQSLTSDTNQMAGYGNQFVNNMASDAALNARRDFILQMINTGQAGNLGINAATAGNNGTVVTGATDLDTANAVVTGLDTLLK